MFRGLREAGWATKPHVTYETKRCPSAILQKPADRKFASSKNGARRPIRSADHDDDFVPPDGQGSSGPHHLRRDRHHDLQPRLCRSAAGCRAGRSHDRRRLRSGPEPVPARADVEGRRPPDAALDDPRPGAARDADAGRQPVSRTKFLFAGRTPPARDGRDSHTDPAAAPPSGAAVSLWSLRVDLEVGGSGRQDGPRWPCAPKTPARTSLSSKTNSFNVKP